MQELRQIGAFYFISAWSAGVDAGIPGTDLDGTSAIHRYRRR